MFIFLCICSLLVPLSMIIRGRISLLKIDRECLDIEVLCQG